MRTFTPCMWKPKMRVVTVLCLCLLTTLWGRAQVLLSENFNASFPTAWSIVNGGSNATTWQRTTNGLAGQTLDGSQFMICNSDAAGNIPAVLLHEELVSPAVNAAGQLLVYLEFDHYFRHIGLTDSGHVDVWDGAAWRRVANYASSVGGFSSPAHEQLNISAYANANLKVRFVYDDNFTWAWYWAIDNVQIVAPVPNDVGVSNFLNPTRNGRRLTALALGATEAVQVAVTNHGSTTLSNVPVYYRTNGGATQGPTILPGPLTPGQTQNLTFAATANLAAAGNYRLQAWTGLAADANHSNDSLAIDLRQLPNNPPTFPHCISMESLADTVLQTNVVGMPGLDEMDFSTNVLGAGRLRTHAGTGFAHTGNQAATLDRSPTGSPDAINFVTFTWNLAQFHAATDQLVLDLWLMEHGDENQLRDSIWIRGCDTCTWIDALNWNQLTGGMSAIYFQTPALNVSTLLASHGQDYASSFQLRIGQEDNFAATSLSGSDGMTFDDICLRRILPINAGVTALLSPQAQGDCGDASTSVAVTVTNLGTNSLASIPVRVVVTGATTATFNTTLLGPVAAGASVTTSVGTLNTLAGGNYRIAAFTMVAADSSQGDDTLIVNAQLSPQLAMPSALGDTFCLGDSGWVHVAQPDSSLEYAWYDGPTNGNLLGLGDSLAVGPQWIPTAYYVEPRSITQGHLGPRSNQMGAGSDFASLAEGLVFDAFQAIVIDSVWVYPSDTGSVRLVLFSAAGVRLDSATAMVMPSFPQAPTRILVGLHVPAGTGYRLRGGGSTVPGLYRNTAGATYPYVLPGVAQITGTASGLSGYYYFWYDWVVRYSHCPGPRGLAMTDTTTALPTAAFGSNALGLQVQFTNASQHAQYYAWDFGDGATAQSIAPQHTYALDGIYTVCLIADGPCGADTLCQVITVNCLSAQPGFLYMTAGLDMDVEDTTSAIVGQSWDFGDGQTATGQFASHTYSVDGDYEVCLQVWNVCADTAQYCDSVQVCGPLTAAIGFVQNGGAGMSFDFSDLSAGTATAWEWHFGDGNMSTLENPTHAYAMQGNYIATLIVTNLCGEQDSTSITMMVVGLSDAHWASIKIYPNPTTGLVTLDLPADWQGSCHLQLHDLVGKIVQEWEIELQGAALAQVQRLQLVLSGMANGSYWLKVTHEDRYIALPVVRW